MSESSIEGNSTNDEDRGPESASLSGCGATAQMDAELIGPSDADLGYVDARAREGRKARYFTAPLIVLTLVNFIDQVDVAILRGVLPILKDQWLLSDFKLGLLGFAFVFLNAIATIPAGWVADRYRRTRVIGYTLLSWSGLSALCAAAPTYWSLFGARATMGIGQAIDDPASTSLLGDYYPPQVRGRVFSWQQVAVFAGSGVGLALGGLVGSKLGWRWAFILVGMPGSLIAFSVFRLREPRRGESDGTAGASDDREEMPSMRDFGKFMSMASRSLYRELKAIMRIPTMRYVLVGAGTLLFTVTGVAYWLPIYHQRYSGMSVVQSTAMVGGLLASGGIIGTFWGGSLADRIYGRGYQGRIVMVATAIMICTGLFLLSYAVPIVPVRMALQFLGVTAISCAPPALRASMMDVVPAESRGVGTSAFALVSQLTGAAGAPFVVGFLSDLTSLLGAFLIISPPIFIGTLILLRAKTTITRDAQAILTAVIEQRDAEA